MVPLSIDGVGLPRSARSPSAGRGPVGREAGRNGHSASRYSFAEFLRRGRSGEEPRLAAMEGCICGRPSVVTTGRVPSAMSSRSRLHRHQEDSWFGMQVQVTLALQVQGAPAC